IRRLIFSPRWGDRGVNPALPLLLTHSPDARGRRESVGVDRLIAQPDPVFVEPSKRLLKQPWLRVTRLYGSFDDVKPVLVHVNPGKGAGFISVVRELQLMSFDLVHEIPFVACQPGVAFHELP